MADALHFDEASHTYTLRGKRLPSVTQVLSMLDDFEGIPAAVLEHARERGSRLHAAVNLYNRDDLVMDSLDDEIRPLVEAWGRFLDETGAVVLASECRVYHPTLGYAGTLDVELAWKNKIVIPDLKATWAVPRTVGAQTAAYAEARHAMNGARGRRPERGCVHLKGNTYNYVPRNDPADFQLFVSCLNVHRFREKAA